MREAKRDVIWDCRGWFSFVTAGGRGWERMRTLLGFHVSECM